MNTDARFKRIDDHRFREKLGLYFEEFRVGDVFEHRPGRTITEADNIWMSLLTMNSSPIHFDSAYAATTEWRRCLVDSTITIAVLTGMSVRTLTGKVVANLGWDNIRLTNPVFAGDTLYAESEILGARESRSRPTQGVVTARTTGKNQEGLVVCTFERTFLVYKRDHDPCPDIY